MPSISKSFFPNTRVYLTQTIVANEKLLLFVIEEMNNKDLYQKHISLSQTITIHSSKVKER